MSKKHSPTPLTHTEGGNRKRKVHPWIKQISKKTEYELNWVLFVNKSRLWFTLMCSGSKFVKIYYPSIVFLHTPFDLWEMERHLPKWGVGSWNFWDSEIGGFPARMITLACIWDIYSNKWRGMNQSPFKGPLLSRFLGYLRVTLTYSDPAEVLHSPLTLNNKTES